MIQHAYLWILQQDGSVEAAIARHGRLTGTAMATLGCHEAA